jgi:hypothetical protein
VEHLPKKQVVDEGSLPGVIQAEVSGDVLPQCVACEYAGCICIVVVIVVVPKASAITAKAIVMASFCTNSQYYI